jgi:hypothetical protein
MSNLDINGKIESLQSIIEASKLFLTQTFRIMEVREKDYSPSSFKECCKSLKSAKAYYIFSLKNDVLTKMRLSGGDSDDELHLDQRAKTNRTEPNPNRFFKNEVESNRTRTIS